jgi:hypothetical protein
VDYVWRGREERKGRSREREVEKLPSPPMNSSSPSGPHASDYESTKASLESLHAKNLAAKEAAQRKADASQAEFRRNQEEVQAACEELERGLDTVEGGYGQRVEEYEELLSNRTEVARALNLQLRKKSKYTTAAQRGNGEEETMESILDSLSNWFVARSSRAVSEESFFIEEEQEVLAVLDRLAGAGGAEGTMEDIFHSIKFSPELRKRLVEQMKHTAGREVEKEENLMRELQKEVERIKRKWEEDQARVKHLEEQLEGRIPLHDKPAFLLAGGKGKHGAEEKKPAQPASRVELENLLKKKLKLISDLEKKRTKLHLQYTSLSKSSLEKDRALEIASNQIQKLTLDLAAQEKEAGVQGGEGKKVHDSLTKQLLLRSSQQAEEFGALKLFVAHTLWEREEGRTESYQLEQEAQIGRIREAFDRLLTSKETTLQQEHIIKSLQIHPPSPPSAVVW